MLTCEEAFHLLHCLWHAAKRCRVFIFLHHQHVVSRKTPACTSQLSLPPAVLALLQHPHLVPLEQGNVTLVCGIVTKEGARLALRLTFVSGCRLAAFFAKVCLSHQLQHVRHSCALGVPMAQLMVIGSALCEPLHEVSLRQNCVLHAEVDPLTEDSNRRAQLLVHTLRLGGALSCCRPDVVPAKEQVAVGVLPPDGREVLLAEQLELRALQQHRVEQEPRHHITQHLRPLLVSAELGKPCRVL
mmetsp:Transcript_60186/g.99859  ORF Transcript_60186/g.99859 Transcript_60186/m.99859 type:complete len:243 (-) Transcript_60186:244-972(-)